jgi:hypothetical protein
VLNPAALLQQFLRGLLIRPKIGGGGFGFYLFQFGAFCRDIKETSRAVPRVSLNRRKRFLIPELTELQSLFRYQKPDRKRGLTR